MSYQALNFYLKKIFWNIEINNYFCAGLNLELNFMEEDKKEKEAEEFRRKAVKAWNRLQRYCRLHNICTLTGLVESINDFRGSPSVEAAPYDLHFLIDWDEGYEDVEDAIYLKRRETDNGKWGKKDTYGDVDEACLTDGDIMLFLGTDPLYHKLPYLMYAESRVSDMTLPMYDIFIP